MQNDFIQFKNIKNVSKNSLIKYNMKQSRPKSIFNKIFLSIFCTTTFALMITLADLFSGLITVGGYSFAGESINLSEYSVFAVCTSSHETKLMADELSENIKLQGGAGYVYMSKQSYYVVAGIYENEADATKVKQNLIASKPQTEVIKITSQAISISNNLEQEKKGSLLECLNVFKQTYKKLYDISISLDTAVINEVNARLQINETASNASTILGNYTTLFANNMSSQLLKIKLAVEELCSSLNSLMQVSSLFPFTSLVKETYCKVIMQYNQLASNLNM